MRKKLAATKIVHVTPEQARQWFLALEDHPERYQFDTHAGFFFEEGHFGEIGARFSSQETFFGLQIKLHFELTDTGDTYFRFNLRRPPLPVWGAFSITQHSHIATQLALEIGGKTPVGTWVLQLPFIRQAIQHQIQGEVDHIADSMETVFKNARLDKPKNAR